MLNIFLSDVVTVEFSENGYDLFREFNKDKNYHISEHGAFCDLTFLALMHFLVEYTNKSLIEDNMFTYKGRFVYLHCISKVRLTKKGEEEFGHSMMEDSLFSAFSYLFNDCDWSSIPELVDGPIAIDDQSYHSVFHYTMEDEDYHGTAFCLQNEDKRIILSNPRVQPFNSYHFESMKNAIHFYYDIEIQEDVNYRCDEPEWITIYSKDVFECGVIEHLPNLIDHIIELDVEKEGQIVKTENKHIATLYKILSGFCDEDTYEIIRLKNLKTGHEYFDFSCFLGDSQISSNILGVRFGKLRKVDLKFIKEWSKKFIEYTEEITRDLVKREFEAASSDKKVSNGKLYQYHSSALGVDYDRIKTIYLPGDVCRFDTKEIEYGKLVIKELHEDHIIDINNKRYELPELLYLCYEVEEDKLYYNKEQCKEEIRIRLEDVLDKDVNDLIECAIDTCWMCRTEHGFENPREVAAEILKELKKEKRD